MAKTKNTTRSRNTGKRTRSTPSKAKTEKTSSKPKTSIRNKRSPKTNASPDIRKQAEESSRSQNTTTAPKRKTTTKRATATKRTIPSKKPAVLQKPQEAVSRSEPPKVTPVTLPPEEKINIKLDQSVAILIDGNNIEMSLHTVSKSAASMINFDKLVPALLQNRSLSRLIYFREGKSISKKLADRLQKLFHGSVVPCYKSADIPLSIKAVQIASKVDTIIILSGDADYVELVRHLKHDGIRVEIAAFPETSAEILLSEADYFFPITTDYSFALK
ncbi:MAG: NYN domain-containing protein [Bacteroidota bacterium]